MIHNTFLILFANDSNLFISGRDSDMMMKTLNAELKEISLWFTANKLNLNIKKTHFMNILVKIRLTPMYIDIDRESISENSKTKFLGIIIDN